MRSSECNHQLYFLLVGNFLHDLGGRGPLHRANCRPPKTRWRSTAPACTIKLSGLPDDRMYHTVSLVNTFVVLCVGRDLVLVKDLRKEDVLQRKWMDPGSFLTPSLHLKSGYTSDIIEINLFFCLPELPRVW